MKCISAVRSAVGEDIKIRIDANGSWNLTKTFIIMKIIERFKLEYCEEAIPFTEGKNLIVLRILHALTKVPLAVDESCRDQKTLDKIIQSKAIENIIVKPAVSGLKESLAIIRNARKSGLKTIVTTTYDSGIGTTLAIHLAAATGEKSAHGLSTLDLLSGDLIENPPQIENGNIVIPKNSGLGIKTDIQQLEQYATGDWEEVS
jgi:O-succinylbenzoate synthase